MMYFNIRFEMTKNCDNAVKKFGKRGKSWNGSLLFCAVQVYVEPDVYDTRQETIYINHFSVFDNK